MIDLTTRTIKRLFDKQVTELTRRTINREDTSTCNIAERGYYEYARTNIIPAGDL